MGLWEQAMRTRVLIGACSALLIAAIGAVTASPSKPTAKAAKMPAPAVISGRSLFVNTCAVCHGTNGQGDDGPSLQGLGLPPAAIKPIVQNGFKDEMPSFAKRFKPAELDALAGYVSTLKK
jgi:mono/diheme cytochrome c family protein